MNMRVALQTADSWPAAKGLESGEEPGIGRTGRGTLRPLARLRRPRLLARAARQLAGEAPKGSLTRRLVRGPLPERGARLGRLLGLEAEAEAQRRAGAPAYSPRRHVEILAAILQEAPARTGR